MPAIEEGKEADEIEQPHEDKNEGIPNYEEKEEKFEEGP